MRVPPLIATIAALAAVALAMTACGADTVTDPEVPVSSEPGEDVGDDTTDDEFGADVDADAAREEARAVLGMPEEDLPEDVRISRRGDESFMLTEDYVLGRLTVELDDDGDGYRVTSVVVELPDGPETFELEPS